MFKEKFIKLCNKKGVPPTIACQDIGLNAATFSKWTEDSLPRKATLQKFADYFGVSVDHLLGNEPESENKKTTPAFLPNGVVVEYLNVYMIPVYESVSAGFGALANEAVQEYHPLYFTTKAEADETLCVRVSGDSMFPKIEDGDIIQVHKQEEAPSGAIAVLLIDPEKGESECLVKKIVYGHGYVELQSINPMYPPLRFVGSDMNRVKVLGVVKKIIKSV